MTTNRIVLSVVAVPTGLDATARGELVRAPPLHAPAAGRRRRPQHAGPGGAHAARRRRLRLLLRPGDQRETVRYFGIMCYGCKSVAKCICVSNNDVYCS